MTSMLMELYDALMSAGASETKAKAAAVVVPHGKDLCTKQDLLCTKQDLEKGLADVREGLTEVRADMKVLKFAVFSMYPFILALVIKIFFLT